MRASFWPIRRSSLNVLEIAYPSLHSLNNAGQVTFFSSIVGGSTDFGFFIATPGLISPVVVNGQPAPGTTGTFGLFGGVNDYHLNAAGDVAFRAFVVGGGPIGRGI